jgi:hypothetical protein
MFNGVFLKLGNKVINEAAIVSVDLDHNGKVVVETTTGQYAFTNANADQLRRLYNSDPEIWAQREGPGWCGVLDLTPEEEP